MGTFPTAGFVILLSTIFVQQCVSQAYNSFSYKASPALIDCVQCNARQRGIQSNCDDPAQVHNCTGCVKTKTKVRIKESGTMTGLYKHSEVISRFCMARGARRQKPAGCYKNSNNGGYTEQCFCYTHNCNSPATKLHPEQLLMFALSTIITARISLRFD